MDTNVPTPDASSSEEQSKKYIRTFAGDMEILQKGGSPDLVPLAEAPTTPVVQPVVVPPPPSIEQIQPPQPTLSPTPSKPPQLSLQTYEGDFSNRIKETHASTVSILAAEQDSGKRAPQEVPQEPSRVGLPYIIGGVALFIVGIVGVYTAYTHYLVVSAPVVLAPSVSTPIFVDEREEVSGTGLVLLQVMKDSVNRPLASGTVRLLYLASTTSSDSIFSALPLSAPDTLLRNIRPQGNIAGVIHVGGVQSPFFILSVLSYSNTFSALLSWEPVMPLYLAELFPPYSAPQPPVIAEATTTTATTTKKSSTKTANVATSTNSLQVITPTSTPTITFFDTTINNHDARIYRDALSRTILVYGYWDRTTLVIARDVAAFTEIVGRLATTRTH